MELHPTIEDFEALLGLSSRPSDAARKAWVVRHLLAGCAVCRSSLREIRGAQTLFSRLFDLPTGSDGGSSGSQYSYEWAFARAGRTLLNHLSMGSPQKGRQEQLAELSDLTEGEQVRRVRTGGRFANPELVEALIDRSHAARYRSPQKTLHFADLARWASEACTSGVAGGQEQLADLQVRAWGAFGNALRICGNFSQAEEAFEKALQKGAMGTVSPRTRARLLSQLCALRFYQRRFEEAIKLSVEAELIAVTVGDTDLEVSLLVQKGGALVCAGEAEEAVGVLQTAIPKIDQQEDPLLFLAAHHNLARCYIDLDQPDEAVAILFEARSLYRDCDPLILLRAIWQEGQLLREVGHLRNAEAALLRACQGFEEQGLFFEMALVCLDLGEIYWKLGQWDQLRQILGKAVPIFRSLRLSREVLASLLRLQQAADLGSPQSDRTG